MSTFCRGWRRIAVVTLVMICGWIGCGRSQPRNRLPYGPGLIFKAGEYTLEKDRLYLIVSSNGGLIGFSLRDATGKELLVEPHKSNTAMRWFIFWDSEQKRLWRYSGDIGFNVWKFNSSDGSLLEEEIDSFKSQGSSEIPKVVYDALPDSSKK